MNSTASLTPHEVLRLLSAKRKLWLTPAIVGGLLAAAYSLAMTRYWEASQALVVRQETAGSANPTPGKFADLFEMRTMQETILELAKSQQVVVATLTAVDRQLTGVAPQAPTAEAIEKFRGRLKMLPPDGGEFGKTEVFYFYVKDASRKRAVALVGELCRQLDVGLKQHRVARAGGLINELEQQAELAALTHAEQSQRLTEFESSVGADLGELRMLHSASSGQSDLRQESVVLEGDLRKFQTQVREVEQLLTLLRSAEQDPQQIVATPNSLLDSQPALRRLKDGLVDAQLATARVGGTRSSDHPRVKAAVDAEGQIRNDLHRELAAAVKGAEVELQLAQGRVTATQARLTNLQDRLGRLAERRAEYSNRVAAVDNSRISLDQVRQQLSAAKAAQAAAQSGSLVTRIDQPETGAYPAGPGRTVVAAAGVVGGLMLGLGLVFLTSSPRPSQPSTSSDGAQRGRRAADYQRPTPPAPSEPDSKEWWNAISNASADVEPAPSVNPGAVSPPRKWNAPVTAAPSAAAIPSANSAVLPVASGRLPNAAATGVYGGMSLQEALQTAATTVSRV